tara:strand:+ start:354 stop:857 length:504 start_codon:yes stop_codon:yes gene_type:complete
MNYPQFNAEDLFTKLQNQICNSFLKKTNVNLVGIYSGGVWIAERLASSLGLKHIGSVDVSFYRDDFSSRGLPSKVRPTNIPFNVNSSTILLVDDVLYTGRTTRAAINTLFDYGRPSKIILATLVDRGDRELPISPDFCAANVELNKNESLILKKDNNDNFELLIENA